MTEIQIARINELARKSKVSPLNPDEKAEQEFLRSEYRAAIKRNLTSQLSGYEYVGGGVDGDGTK
jgi:uncharacterized protein YnzC (UPF0291/DUF896 family)